jgi:phosphopantetheine--protein transferase-like protein
MNENKIHRLDVETPLGVVHLAGFDQKPDHRSVIFGILSEFCGESVTAADLVESKENTRPEFPKLDFDVNWTHSGGYCVCAFGERGTRGRLRIGVDLERYSPKRLHLAERFFSKEESAQLATLNVDQAQKEFFKLWCRKEAFYKCVGGEFFEGTLRRDMQKNPVLVDAPDLVEPVAVHFVDLDAAVVGMPTSAALCVAVSRL